EPGSIAYLIPSAWHIQGALNIQALEQSLNELVRRHESLRTTFQEREREPEQVIHPPRAARLPLIDLQGLPEAARQPLARHLAAREGQQPCDLARGPLFRTALLRLQPADHVLFITMHHIISDGWSQVIFLRELTALYQARVINRPAPL